MALLGARTGLSMVFVSRSGALEGSAATTPGPAWHLVVTRAVAYHPEAQHTVAGRFVHCGTVDDTLDRRCWPHRKEISKTLAFLQGSRESHPEGIQ